MKYEIEVGDVVKLKCDGPIMVVGKLDAVNKEAYCYWFLNDLFNSAIIPLDALSFVRKG